MKKIAMLLDGPISTDGRVRRMIQSLSQYYYIDLFYCNPSKDDLLPFNNNVRLFPYKPNSNFVNVNFFMHKKFTPIIDAVLKTNIKYDVIFCNDYPLLSVATKLKHLLKASLIYDSHEIYISTMNQFFPQKGLKGWLFGRILTLINKIIHSVNETRLIKKVDCVITVNESLSDYFIEKYELKKVLVIKNCPHLEPLIPKNNLLKNNLNLNTEAKIIIYQGTLNMSRGLPKLLKSAVYFDHKNHLIIIGEGPMKNELKQLSTDLNCDRVHFLDAVPYNILQKYIVGSDLGIVLIEAKNLSKKLSLPNKVFEYMAAGIPFVTNSLPEASEIARSQKCGFVINDSSPQLIAMEINKILDSADLSNFGNNGRKAIENTYNWQMEFANAYESLKSTIEN